MKKLEFILPLPPSMNHAFMRFKRRSNSGKMYLAQKRTSKADKWYYNAIEYVRECIDSLGWQATKEEKVVVDLEFTLYRRKACDTHNTLKLLLDVLEKAGVYDNDYYALPRINNFVVIKGTSEVKVTCYLLKEE